MIDDMENIDLFTDLDVATNPLPYVEYLRSKGDVVPLPNRNIVAVTSYDLGMATLQDPANFSSVIAFAGPLIPTGISPSEDITDQIEKVRPTLPGGDTLITADMPEHKRVKSLLMGVITPKRVAQNQKFIEAKAKELVLSFVDNGKAELLGEYGRPLASETVAHLLGVPEGDLPKIAHMTTAIAGGVNRDAAEIAEMTDERIRSYFRIYVKEARDNPREDVMSEIASTRYEDGSLPPIEDVVSLAALLFAAGEDTASRAIVGAIRWIAEDLELQAQVRANRSIIPNLIEEVLRFDGPGLVISRMVTRPVKVGDMDVSPGTIVMTVLPGMNRDPRRFGNPGRLDPMRENSRDHLAFGRGIHACPGAPVARAEIRIAIEQLLDHTASFQLDDEFHGPEGARKFKRLPSYFVQGLDELHIKINE